MAVFIYFSSELWCFVYCSWRVCDYFLSTTRRWRCPAYNSAVPCTQLTLSDVQGRSQDIIIHRVPLRIQPHRSTSCCSRWRFDRIVNIIITIVVAVVVVVLLKMYLRGNGGCVLAPLKTCLGRSLCPHAPLTVHSLRDLFRFRQARVPDRRDIYNGCVRRSLWVTNWTYTRVLLSLNQETDFGATALSVPTRLSCILSFRVQVKLFYRIVSYRCSAKIILLSNLFCLQIQNEKLFV